MKSKKVLLMGNPNVGKSTVFNELTGMHQHTGNWTGNLYIDGCSNDNIIINIIITS